MSPRNTCVSMLAVLTDSDDEDNSEYRFLLHEKYVKYVTIAPGTLPKDDRTFAPKLLALLPNFPPGDWNDGHIDLEPTTGRPRFAHVRKLQLPGITDLWHETRVDHLDFTSIRQIRRHIRVATHPQFKWQVVIKYAEFPWEIDFYARETTAYKRICDRGVGPQFLGHILEEGRCIGFVLELIREAREAEPGDLLICQQALGRLHALGLKHGDVNRFNILVRDGGAVLVDFETMEECKNSDEMESERLLLRTALRDSVSSDARTNKHQPLVASR